MSLFAPQVTETNESIARLSATLPAVTGGNLTIESSVTVEDEPLRAAPGQSIADVVGAYLAPRINGGEYQAEDRVYRGPFDMVVVVAPYGRTQPFIVNGTPVHVVPYYAAGGTATEGALDAALVSTIVSELAAPARPGAVLAETPLRTQLQKGSGISVTPGAFGEVLQPSFRSSNFKVSVDTNNERGKVLTVAEVGVGRNGGVGLPLPVGGLDLNAKPNLTFYVRTTSLDPLAVRISDGAKAAWASLGRDRVHPAAMGQPVAELPLNRDGAWQQITVDLKGLATQAGLSKIDTLALEIPPASRMLNRMQGQPIQYQFDDFELTSQPPTTALPPRAANAASTDPEERALAVMELAKAGTASAELVKFLKDPSDFVRLQTANAYRTIVDPAAEAALIENTNSLDPVVAEAALRALANQKTETALAAIRRSLKYGVTERSRAIAAHLLAETKDPKLAGDIMILITNRNWQTRLAAVEAIGKLPGPEAGIIGLAFIQQADPEIKLAATRLADPTREYDMRKVLWSAVNEPSDAVRALSLIKLMQSPTATFKAEGYKGVRDDSRFVRLQVLDWMAQNPDEAHRGALRLAVTDRSAAVRAQALRAFASLREPTTLDEITNVMSDQDSEVQLALIGLAKAKGLKLSAETLGAMRNSSDPRVVEASKSLG
jgi:HEAT repeat protein